MKEFELITDWRFWVAMCFSITVKLMSSNNLTPRGAVFTVIMAVGAAVIFTDPILFFFELDNGRYTYAISAVTALLGEQAARQILSLNLKEWLDLVRGK